VWVAVGGRCLGRFMLRDKPRAEAREALAAMRALGINRLVLLTGDIALAAWGILDPLAGASLSSAPMATPTALAQSLAVFAIVANSARILRFGSQSVPRRAAGPDASDRPANKVYGAT